MKKIFPILFIVLMIGAWISIIYRNYNVPKEYGEIMSCAKASYESGYYLEALAYLDKAETLLEADEVYSAVEMRRNIYHDMQDGNLYERQCLSMIESYPEKEENYEKLIQYYWDLDDYSRLCRYLPEYFEKWTDNVLMKEIDREFSRLYTYTSTNYFDVQYASDSLVNVQELEYEVNESDEDKREQIVRVLKNSNGNDVFRMGYAQMAVSMDNASCFVCDQKGVWTRVDILNNLLAKNEKRKFQHIGRLGENNIAPAICDGKYYFINEQMKVSDISWECASNFSEGVSAVKKNGKWALVTSDNWNSDIDFIYTDIPLNSQNCATINGIAVVADTTGYYIVGTDNFMPISEDRYEKMKAFECNQPTAYRKGDKWGFVNRMGEVYIEPVYEDAKPFMNGYAAVKENGVWGYIDRDGVIVVEPQFQEALNVMSSGVAYIKNDMGYWDYITITRLFYEN